MKSMKSIKALCLIAAFVLSGAALAAVEPASSVTPVTPEAEAPKPVVTPKPAVTPVPVVAVTPVVEVEVECDEVDLVTEATPVSTEAAKPCKACQDRPWCKCTYNGQRRASCNPCCYANDIGHLICLD
jgi:hypothetical protein